MFSAVLSLALLMAGGFGLGAQEGASPAGASAESPAEAPSPVLPAEGEIFLGEESPGVSVAEPGPVSGFAIFRTVLLVILAAAAIYGLVHVVKKLSQAREPPNSSLRILAAVRLGPGRFLHLVALGSRAWLVGSGEGGISHIADITEQETLDTLFLEESRQNGASGRTGDFQSLLRRLGVLKSPEKAGDQENLAEKIRLRRDRLRGL
ncbi:MAG: flagellar biosynthetic protein FliO [Treponema sp.]|nr:flagellar biosynthetic protein FliO [Treponema sp.]